MDEKNKIYDAIKNDFYQKFKANIEKGDYHQKDLERLQSDVNHDWVKAFYKHGFSNHDKTVNIIHEVLLWRNEFDANNLLTPGKLPFPNEFLHKGSIFYRNEDINCNPILHFVVKLHKKDQFPFAQICKFIAFHFERAYKFNEDDPIVLLFDMSDAGYSNLDMDMIKFVISCLKTYYPGLIDYMIIFQMPFIFNAAWKIIKNWLPPEAIKLIKFCDKKSIREFVQESQLFVHMGGTDTYKYSFDPKQYPEASASNEAGSITGSKSTSAALSNSVSVKKPPLGSTSVANMSFKSSGPMSPMSRTDSIDDEVISSENGGEEKPTVGKEARIVKERSFKSISGMEMSPQDQTIYTVDLTKSQVNFSLSDDSPISIQKNTDDAQTIKSVKSGKMNGMANGVKSFDVSKASELSFENVLSTPLLSISPGDELIYNVNDGKSDIVQFIKLTNTSGVSLAYKIKITSPDKFRVKPGTGIIQTSSCVQIMISFLKEFHVSNTGNRDKFLILWTPIEDQQIQQGSELNEFWKQAIQKKTNINEHKVKCVIIRPSMSDMGKQTAADSKSTVSTNISTMSTNSSQATLKLNKVLGEPLVNEDKRLNSEQIQKNDAQLTTAKIANLELNMENLLSSQNRLVKQQSVLVFLVYFLIVLNLIQLLINSNSFAQFGFSFSKS